jgi:nitroreductase
MVLDAMTAIATRSSCRSYTGALPDVATLQAIAKAGLAAPSAVNRQPWEIRLVTNRELRDEIEAELLASLEADEDKTGYNRIMSRGGKPFYDAPCLIVVAKDAAQEGAPLDSGIVVQNLALAATALGVDNVICGMARLALAGPKKDYFAQKLNLSLGYEFAISILLGHAATPQPAPHQPDLTKLQVIE